MVKFKAKFHQCTYKNKRNLKICEIKGLCWNWFYSHIKIVCSNLPSRGLAPLKIQVFPPDLLENLQKMSVDAKARHQEIRWKSLYFMQCRKWNIHCFLQRIKIEVVMTGTCLRKFFSLRVETAPTIEVTSRFMYAIYTPYIFYNIFQPWSEMVNMWS